MTIRNAVKVALRTWPSVLHSVIPGSRSRRFRAYCVGLPRSGTHSMGYVFAGEHQAMHEAWVLSTLYVICEHADDRVAQSELESFLSYRDKRLGLEFESSHYLHRVVSTLVDIHPESRFVFTVREPVSWLESVINQSIKARVEGHWRAYENRVYGRYGDDFHHDRLAGTGAYPVRNYLAYWSTHVRRVMENVPPNRLCVVDTFEIDDQLDRIARFVGTAPEKLDRSRRRSGGRKEQWIDIDRDLDVKWIRGVVARTCGETIKEYVPFVKKYIAR